MKNILMIAPHPDDETLGCGGFLLKAIASGAKVTWGIGTAMTKENGYTDTQISARRTTIERVAKAYGFAHTFEMCFPAGSIDKVDTAQLIGKIKEAIKLSQAELLMIPYEHDVHTDHRIIAQAAVSASKWFREPTIRQIMMYETPSETDFNVLPSAPTFKPNVFTNISTQFERKLQILDLYHEELGDHPFPRSKIYCESLAKIRGAQSGFQAAEAFTLIKELQP